MLRKIYAIVMSLLLASLTTVPVLGADSDTTSVSATLGNRAPDVYQVDAIGAQDPTEGTTTTVTFNVTVNDDDGYGDISTVQADFTRAGETTRSDASCTGMDTVNATAQEFECSVDMQFYDETGSWDVNVTAVDSGALSDSNTDTSFTYNELEAWTMTPTSLSFGTIYLGQTDVGATDDPIVMTNTGNHDLTGEVKVTALDLVGESTPSDFIPAENFTVNVADSQGGDAMVNNTGVTITGTSLDRGSSSTEDLYFYLEEVLTGLSYQVYSTVALGEWTVSTT
jgi:hypothetical protein